MPRVKSVPSDKDVILKHMREYAILKELEGAGDGSFSTEVRPERRQLDSLSLTLSDSNAVGGNRLEHLPFSRLRA